MARARYSKTSEMVALGFLVNVLDSGKGGDGDTGALFPRTDAEDMSKGAQFIPGEVTLARRAGKWVNFVTEGSPNCWYWEMPDGSRIYHAVEGKYGDAHFEDGPGPCPDCGNFNTSDGTVK